ncbi:MAG: cytidine deaminase [Odoribacteraceae bacterium]|jgi:cytidine deaminase|nr:cytidine deaminase [Odoribacteraceae bacterium]
MQDKTYDMLSRAARSAVENAYSVYSRFSVGAAVLMDNGEIIRGSNQENVASPSGLCAERVALFYACSAYPGVRVRAIAIAARDASGRWVPDLTPCGACRQVMAEIIHRYHSDFDVILPGPRDELTIIPASTLLPAPFSV